MNRNLLLSMLVVAGASVLPREVSANHRNWVLRNAGSQCAFSSPTNDADAYNNGGLWNGAAWPRLMTCPVSLSARWNGFYTAYAMGAMVYMRNEVSSDQEFYCSVRARFSTPDTLYYSRTVSTTAVGDRKLSVAFDSAWAGTLEAAEGGALRSLDFLCRVPSGGSGVYGYKARMCQSTAACKSNGGGDGEDLASLSETNSQGSDFIQMSGIECISYTTGSSPLERTEAGIRNTSSSSWQYASVYCPLSPPADDTYDPWRYIPYGSMKVYYSGGVGDLTCQLSWRNRHPELGGTFWSRTFVPDGPGVVRLDQGSVQNGLLVGWDVAMAIWCDLGPGRLLKGATAKIPVYDQVNAQ